MNSEYLLGLEAVTWNNAQVSVESFIYFLFHYFCEMEFFCLKTYKSETHRLFIKEVN